MSEQTAPAVSPEEIAEIEEYDKIAQFSEDVLAGLHPRVKINVPPTSSAPAPAPVPLRGPSADPAIAIDFKVDCYKALGLSGNVKPISIERAFKAKMDVFAPYSPTAEHKWVSESKEVRDRVKQAYEQAVDANRVLSDPALRRQYDAGRIVDLPVRVRGPVQSSALKPTLASELIQLKKPVKAVEMMAVSWADQVKQLPAKTNNQIDDQDDGEASDGDSTKALYWGAVGKKD